MADLFPRSRSAGGRRRPPRDGFGEREAKPRSGDGGLFGWTVFILLLIGLVAICWMGTLYVFGHPEEPLGYNLLQRFKKLEPPKRFTETAAPKGEFLDAKKLLARYGQMTPRQLKEESARLLRAYIRNYDTASGPVPYVVGRFNILDSYQLTKDDFFPSGVVAIAQDAETPQVLVEQAFTADERTVPTLHRSLLTGLDIPIQRSINLSPVIHIERLTDGRLKFTTVPIQYPDYSATQGPGGFSLQPPPTLNVEAGLPILSRAKVTEADQRYASYRRKLANPNAATPPTANALLPVRAATTATGETPQPTVARALPVNAAPTPAPAPIVAATPANEPPVARAIPVNGEEPPAPVANAPTVGAEVPLKPFLVGANTPAPAVATTTSGKWPTYRPGEMPRGRLVGVQEAPQLAGTGLGAERVYLQGDFTVSASSQSRAVLRKTDGSKDMRIIVEFPTTTVPPGEGATLARDARRPFLITRVERGSDGTVNVWAREVTSE